MREIDLAPKVPNWVNYPLVNKHNGQLVGGFNPSAKKIVSWGDSSQYMGKKCSKPPTSNGQSILGIISNGNFRILKWRYLPYIRPIFQAYVSEYLHKKCLLWYSTSILGS